MLNNNYDPSQRIWDPEFFFEEARRIFRLSMNNKLDEALLECDLNMFKSYFYPFAKGGLIAVLSVSSLDKVSEGRDLRSAPTGSPSESESRRAANASH